MITSSAVVETFSRYIIIIVGNNVYKPVYQEAK